MSETAEISDLYRRIAGVTTRFEFTAPLESSDIDTVHAELTRALPEDCVAVVESRGAIVHVEVRRAGRRLYARDMIVSSDLPS